MTRIRRTALGLLLASFGLVACANASSIVPAGDGSTGGGTPGTSGISVPGNSGSGVPIDRENPIDRVMKPCDLEYTPGDGPDTAVGTTAPCPDDYVHGAPVASPVEPTPGMADVRARGWDSADVGDDGRSVTISFVSGIEPCAVLDHVDVGYGAKSVTITLYEGHDPAAGDVACIEIGVYKRVVVDLDEPLGDRTIEDGVR